MLAMPIRIAIISTCPLSHKVFIMHGGTAAIPAAFAFTFKLNRTEHKIEWLIPKAVATPTASSQMLVSANEMADSWELVRFSDEWKRSASYFRLAESH